MPKDSYIFKYMVLESGHPVFYTHKIRAMTSQEAYARFRYWNKHRASRGDVTIYHYWLEPNKERGITDDNAS